MDYAKVIETFRSHRFAATYFDTAAEALAYLSDACAGQTVSFGGSVTLEEMGAYEALETAGCTVHWHWRNGGVKRQDSPVYITSANALSATGEIVNIDGAGNRVAAAIYGGETCFTVCGVNKIEPDLDAAIRRAREIAAPRNAQRLGCPTPCAADGKCHDCKSPGRICCAMSVIMAPPLSFSRYELILIGETLGY